MTTGKTATLVIRTPEGIEFSLLLAGPVTRFLAWVVDFCCIGVITMALTRVTRVLSLISPDFAFASDVLAYFAVTIGYGILLEWCWRGQTVGKRLLHLRVMDEQGLRLHFSQVVIRNLLRFVDSLPLFYLVGGLACWLSRRAQRLGDFVANTIVVRNPKLSELDLDQLLAGKFNSFRSYPHLEVRLRERVSPSEAAIALQALLRRDELEPSARFELFGEIAGRFCQVVEFPPEATDGLSDEQYIRNVADVLFREKTRQTKAGKTPNRKRFADASAFHG